MRVVVWEFQKIKRPFLNGWLYRFDIWHHVTYGKVQLYAAFLNDIFLQYDPWRVMNLYC